MTLMDKTGKAISRRLYRYAQKHPGKPTMTSYTNLQRHAKFNELWPWSWRVPPTHEGRSSAADF